MINKVEMLSRCGELGTEYVLAGGGSYPVALKVSLLHSKGNTKPKPGEADRLMHYSIGTVGCSKSQVGVVVVVVSLR